MAGCWSMEEIPTNRHLDAHFGESIPTPIQHCLSWFVPLIQPDHSYEALPIYLPRVTLCRRAWAFAIPTV